MATTPKKNQAGADTAVENQADAGTVPGIVVERPRPRLGETVQVTVAEDVVLMNTETGAPFTPGEATPQLVTVTTLRRLDDGDLTLV
ncbi:MAG: hypothetical protein KBC94_23435 [Pseudacidovorax sp.]|uniref:hypothetical protein n=1 Tax=Pseudacidovorax sp. TaxID=1934311 RepID=UPI001B53E7AD|nr:hypothetical protein [Pseudacidovorax sp.]MBP6897381.1 hypothetical protein [Pseudacidovorax sp.]